MVTGLCGCHKVQVQAGKTTQSLSPLARDTPAGIPGPTEGGYNAVVTCAVCGKPIPLTANTPAEKCGTGNYYFCCPQCQEKFNKNQGGKKK
jgi:YHS domain-containing protein